MRIAVMGLDGMVTTAQPVPFVPARAERFCTYCGFPFRDQNRGQAYCQEYALPDHGRCGMRLRDAQDPDGLTHRLAKTRDADPYARRTSEDAIAHRWVRQHHPEVDLRPWQQAQQPRVQPEPGSVHADPPLLVPAFILTWHPQHFRWEEHGYHQAVQSTAGGQKVRDNWTVGNRAGGISPGNRAYLYRQHDNRGIVASGVFTSGVEIRPHWDGSGRTARYADLEWDIVLDYDDRLSLKILTTEIPRMPWGHLQGSGIEVKPEAAPELHALWQHHTGGILFRSPDEPRTPEDLTFPEGAVSRVEINRYERDPRARRACLQHWGYRCAVCGFSFEESYGPIGSDYIHVHHLLEISRLPAEYQVHPVEDRRPVCPNCHAMIHHGPGPALTVDELKQQLRRQD